MCFTLECRYFLCCMHSYFMSIGINIPQMKSNFFFSDRDIVTGIKYINSLFDQNYIYIFHILWYISLTCFTLLLFQECNFKVKIALLAAKK